jgi:hypothetical protein
VHPQTFETMLPGLRAQGHRTSKPGRPPTRSLEDQRVLTLPYWREYRPSWYIGLSWGVTASVVCRTVQRLENLLSKRKACHVPGKTPVRDGGTAFAVIVVDGADRPVAPPPKNRGATTAGSRGVPPAPRRAQAPRDPMCRCRAGT